MTKMRQRKQPRKLANLLGTALVASMAWSMAAWAADCPRKGTLGTSRILGVDAAATPRVGLKNFPQTLPLEDHEVVLTSDDATGSGGTGPGMRAGNILPDRQAGLRAPCAGAKDSGRGPYHRTSHLAAPQPDANSGKRDSGGNRPGHCRG